MLWKLDFQSRIDLEKVVKSVKEIGMNNFTIKIIKNSDFEGIRAEVTQSGMVCLLRAQLTCDVTKQSADDVDVTLSCEQLLSVLRGSGKPQFRLRIFQNSGDNRIHLESYDSFDRSFRSRTSLTTFFNDDTEMLQLEELSFDLLLQMDLHFLKQVVKNNMELGCENIKISIHSSEGSKDVFIRLTCATEHVEDVKELAGQRAQGDDEQQTQIDFGEAGGEQPATEGPSTTLCENVYDIKYLWSFLRSSETKGRLKMFLSPDNPLLLKVDFFPENSFIYFLQAPKTE